MVIKPKPIKEPVLKPIYLTYEDFPEEDLNRPLKSLKKEILEVFKNFNQPIPKKINEFENVDLPYRYNLVNGEPFMSPKIITYLKQKKGF